MLVFLDEKFSKDLKLHFLHLIRILSSKLTKSFTNAQQFYIMDLTKLPKAFNTLELKEAKIQWGKLFKVKSEEELLMLMENSEEMKETGLSSEEFDSL